MFTQDQLNALDEAIALGALTVKYSDKEVTYRSLADMLATRKLIVADLAKQAGLTGLGNTKFGDFSKGLHGYECDK